MTMNINSYYFNSDKEDYEPSLEELKEFEDERDKIFILQDFASMVEKHTFLEMMILLTEELKKRGYTG